ncbi:MAG: hypothetical protein LBN31_08565, partial [Hungatella sp.]|nr:hypothetical protein [Hungatella sp.]
MCTKTRNKATLINTYFPLLLITNFEELEKYFTSDGKLDIKKMASQTSPFRNLFPGDFMEYWDDLKLELEKEPFNLLEFFLLKEDPPF